MSVRNKSEHLVDEPETVDGSKESGRIFFLSPSTFFTDQRVDTGECVKSSVLLGLCSSSCLVASEIRKSEQQQLLSLPFSPTCRISILNFSGKEPIITTPVSLFNTVSDFLRKKEVARRCEIKRSKEEPHSHCGYSRESDKMQIQILN